MDICASIFIGIIMIIAVGVFLHHLLTRAASNPPAPRPMPDPHTAAPQAQELLSLRNYVSRLETRIASLEASFEILKMRLNTAGKATVLDDDINDVLDLKPQAPQASPTPAPAKPPFQITPRPPLEFKHPTPQTPEPKPEPTAPNPKPVQQPHAQSLPPQPIKAISTPPEHPKPTPVPPAAQPPAPAVEPTPVIPVAPKPTPAIEPASPIPAVPPAQPAPPATPKPAPTIDPTPPVPVQPAIKPIPIPTPTPKPQSLPLEPAAAKAAPHPQPMPIPTPAPAPAPAQPEQPKRPPITLESLLTMRLFVWIAGIVLSLAGILLMKYLNDRSVFPEWSRLVLGAAIGFTGIGVGQYLRANYQRIAATVVGAGLTTLFAVVLAGTLHYTYISKPVAFILLAGIALGAVGLSLRHGMLVAVLGLLGGYVTPALLNTGEPKPVALALYLMFLQTGLVLVIRKRGWMPLAALTLLATMCWAGIMLFVGKIGAQGLPIALLLISTGVQFSLVLDRAKPSESAPESNKDPRHWAYRGMGLVAVALGLLMLSTRVALGDFQVTDWSYLGIVSLALILLGRLKEGYSLFPCFGLAATSFLFFQWMRQPALAQATAAHIAPNIILAGLSAVFVLGGMFAAIKGPHPARFAGLSALAGAVFAGLGYYFQDVLHLHGLMPWVAVLGTVVYAGAAALVQALEAPSRKKTLVLATYLVASSAFALAIAPLWFENWIAPAWAAQVLVMAILARHFKIPLLHGLAAPIALMAFARLTCMPDLLTKTHADLGLFTWILTNYLPVLSLLGGAAWTIATDPITPRALTPDQDPDQLHYRQGAWLYILANILGGLSQILMGVMCTFLFRAAFIPESTNLWGTTPPTPALWALWASMWLAMSLLATTLSAHIHWLKNKWLPIFWIALGTLAGAYQATFLSPLLAVNDINLGGTPIANLLLVLYGLPCLTAALAAWGLHKQGHKILHDIAVIAAATMGLLLVMLQVRHGFVGTPLHGHEVTLAQAGAYSMAGLLLAMGVRWLGLAFGWQNSSRITTGYLLVTGLLFCLFQITAANPIIHPEGVSTTPFFNQLLLAYIVPAFVLIIGGKFLSPCSVPARIIGGLILGLGTTFLIRHGFHPENMGAGPMHLTEAGTYTAVGLLLAAGLRQLSIRFDWPKFDLVTGFYLIAVGMGFIALQIFGANPLFSADQVSTRVFANAILYAYGLPAVLLLAGAQFIPPFTQPLRIVGALMLGLAGTLLIRHGFHPENMGAGRLLLTEAGTYTIAGLMLTAALRQLSVRLAWPAFEAVTGVYLVIIALGVLALQTFAANPIFTSGQVSTRIFLNTILYAYVLPAVLLVAGAQFIPPFTHMLRAAGAIFLALGAALLVRHGFQPDSMGTGPLLLTEAGTYSIVGLILAGALRQLSLRLNWSYFHAITIFYLAVTAIGLFILQGGACNPIFNSGQVSTRIFFNAILYAYGLPSLLAISGAQFLPPVARAVRGAGITGLFITAILLVRHAFHPGDMTEPGVMMIEAAAYTITVKVMGVLAMEWGIRKDDEDTAFIAQTFLYVSFAMAVLGQLLFKNPLVSTDSIGTWPIINGLIVLYLIPGALFGVQAWQCVRRGLQGRAKFNALCAVVMAVIFLTLESRWLFHDAGVLTLFQNGKLALDFLEASTYAPLWLTLGCALSWVGMRKVKPALVQSGFIVQSAAVGWVIFALLMLFNPLLTKHSVGALYIANGITAGFLIPAAILIASSTFYQRERRLLQANIAAWTGHVLLFIGYSLTIRQFFQGEFLDALGMGVAERYVYSAGWVLLAVAYLVVGIITGKHRPRYASLAIMIIGVIKVGYDIFLLQDLLRIISLAGLGLGLLVMTFLYQKYVFKAQEEEEDIA